MSKETLQNDLAAYKRVHEAKRDVKRSVIGAVGLGVLGSIFEGIGAAVLYSRNNISTGVAYSGVAALLYFTAGIEWKDFRDRKKKLEKNFLKAGERKTDRNKS
ncbi:hypothetical protein HYT33_01085 [Candidatus Roizmanbacteria bacterium]|nr:hypothetical protein [Candidatus Roizmanbacteria bacterium]